MELYGLVGLTLKHSFSQRFFRDKFKTEKRNADYRNFELETISQFNDIFKNNQYIKGLNVTIPYKESVIPYLHALSNEAKTIGAVNTIKVSVFQGKLFLKGYNTDCYGFEQSLSPHLDNSSYRALVFGNGGAAKAVKFVLKKLHIPYVIVSRNPQGEGQISYAAITPELLSSHRLIINTTPVGMFPNVAAHPELPYHALSDSHLCYDLIYNPEKTEFLKRAKSNGATIVNGQKMLELQALKSWEVWND